MEAVILNIVTVACYFLATLAYPTAFVFGGDKLRRFASWMTLLGFALHTAGLIYFWVDSDHVAPGSGGFYMSFLAWALLACYFVLRLGRKLDFLALVATPLALFLFVSSFSVAQVKVNPPDSLSALWFGLHVGTLFFSLSLMAMACGAGILFIVIERRIKTKTRLPEFLKGLPSLDTFDAANLLSVKYGFPLYTLGMASGFVWSLLTWKTFFSWDPKEVATVLIWLLYSFLFHQRLALGWRGRKPAWTAVWVFAFTMLSLIGINFFLPTHHSLKP